MSDTTDIGELMQRRLQQSQHLSNLVAGRIRPGAIEQSEVLPAVKYEILSSDSQSDLQGASGEAFTRFQCDCYGNTASEASLVAAAVTDVLHGYRGQLGDNVFVYDCLQDNKFDRRDPPPPGSRKWRYRRVVDFAISHTESTPTLSLD